jgi:hypothetical protein
MGRNMPECLILGVRYGKKIIIRRNFVLILILLVYGTRYCNFIIFCSKKDDDEEEMGRPT